MIDLKDHLDAARVRDLTGTTKDAVLEEMVALVSSSDAVTDAPSLLSAVRERERVLSTGIGLGIAIPHAKIPGVTRFVVAVGRHGAGIEFDAIDGKPVHIVVLIAGRRTRRTATSGCWRASRAACARRTCAQDPRREVARRRRRDPLGAVMRAILAR
jgi:mannitol/fructose-specific phosphotransferase system IIA component